MKLNMCDRYEKILDHMKEFYISHETPEQLHPHYRNKECWLTIMGLYETWFITCYKFGVYK